MLLKCKEGDGKLRSGHRNWKKMPSVVVFTGKTGLRSFSCFRNVAECADENKKNNLTSPTSGEESSFCPLMLEQAARFVSGERGEQYT